MYRLLTCYFPGGIYTISDRQKYKTGQLCELGIIWKEKKRVFFSCVFFGIKFFSVLWCDDGNTHEGVVQVF